MLPIVVGTAVAVGAVVASPRSAAPTSPSAPSGLFAAAAANWLVGRSPDGQAGRELVVPATQERVVLRRRHRLFWIDTEYWSVPVALAALVPLLSLLNLGRG